ncbi:hypothetical protein ACFU8R_14355 [Pseudonocardia alni]|uniref:hypothetical protein n=1 Tax=Pseudonocardia alni TaxID=33907 RepID=UPI003683DAF2
MTEDDRTRELRDAIDTRMVELGYADASAVRPGMDRFYGDKRDLVYGNAYLDNSIKFLGLMPDGTFSNPQVATETWGLDEARRDLARAEQLHNDDPELAEELDLDSIEALRDEVARGEQRLADAERAATTTSARRDPQEPYEKASVSTLAAASVAHAAEEASVRDGDDLGTQWSISEVADRWSDQIRLEADVYDTRAAGTAPGDTRTISTSSAIQTAMDDLRRAMENLRTRSSEGSTDLKMGSESTHHLDYYRSLRGLPGAAPTYERGAPENSQNSRHRSQGSGHGM